MRYFLVAVLFAAVALAAWQRRTLVALRAEEGRIVAEQRGTLYQIETVASQVEEGRRHVSAPTITDAEMADFTVAVFAVQSEFETNQWLKVSDENGLSHPVLCETLRRLTTAQLRAVIEAWPGEETPGGDRATGIHRFMLLAGKVNPAAAVPLMYELLSERGYERTYYDVPGAPAGAFQCWFRKDPDGLLKWAQQARMPEGFGGMCATWADAVLAVGEPSVENVRELASHPSRWDNQSGSEVVLKLPTSAARLRFFQSLHTVTGGVCDDLGAFVWPLAQRLPFSQLAYLADQTPAFKPSEPERQTALDPTPQQLGSLRLEVAARSRDGTAAQRWDWLTQREEDRPSGKLLGRLVKEWCTNDYTDTATWVRSLPPGTARDNATKEVIAFLKWNGASNLVPDWETQ